MNSKIALLDKSPNRHVLIVFVSLIIFLIILFFSYKIYTYDSFKLTGLITCDSECVIKATIPYNYVDFLTKNSKIDYQNNAYEILDVVYEEPYLNEGVVYENVNIKTNIVSQSRIINFKVIYNKQRILRKIINMMEGD